MPKGTTFFFKSQITNYKSQLVVLRTTKNGGDCDFLGASTEFRLQAPRQSFRTDTPPKKTRGVLGGANRRLNFKERLQDLA